MSSPLINFKCAYCDRIFTPPQGGLCSRTHKPYCIFHLVKVKSEDNKIIQIGKDNILVSDKKLFNLKKFFLYFFYFQ